MGIDGGITVVNPDPRKLQECPDGEAGHIERSEIDKQSRAEDATRKRKHFAGAKGKKIRKNICGIEPRKFYDPTTDIPLRIDCPVYKPGCTLRNCPTCRSIVIHRREIEKAKTRMEKKGGNV